MINEDSDNVDWLNFVANKTMDYVNKKAMQIILKNTEFEVRHRLFKDESDGE